MSQQTTNYRPSAWLLPSQLHGYPEEFIVLLLQHLYRTESSVMLRATQMFAREAPRVKSIRQGTAGNSISCIKGKKKLKSLLKIPLKTWGRCDGEYGSHKQPQHCIDLRWSPADHHTALTCETLNEKIQAAGRNLPSLMRAMLAAKGSSTLHGETHPHKASQVQEEPTTSVHCHTHTIHQLTFMCLHFWD